MNKEILNRKGALKITDIPNSIITLLNKGEIASVNLTEWLAVDHTKIVKYCFPKLGISNKYIAEITEEIKKQKKSSAMNSTKLVGTMLHQLYQTKTERQIIFKNLSVHISDTIRCYAPYLPALNEELSIQQKLQQLQVLAADDHFGVREITWMALRPEIEKNLETSVQTLCKWAKNKDDNIRRFASEATRPRGVWCKHIDALKENPGIALSILEPLKSDSSKYVRDSVGNWLNDAAKSQPDFIKALCKKWEQESSTAETKYIVNKALRSL